MTATEASRLDPGSARSETSSAKQDPRRRALGKGLESLLPSRAGSVAPRIHAVDSTLPDGAEDRPQDNAAADWKNGHPLEIPLDSIERNPFQTRTKFDAEKLTELALSIEASGVVQPVVVRAIGSGRYQLITGERRWRASYEARKTHIPAIVRHVSDEQAMEMTIVENLQRTDLNPIEQAKAYQRLSQEFRMTQEQMAIRTGLPRATVANFLRILKLPEVVQTRVEAGELSFGHAKALLSLDSAAAITAAAQKVVALSMSVRATESYIHGLLDPQRESKKSEKVIEPLDPNVKDIRDTLQRALGLRVRIEDKDGRGRVIIEYTRLEDFDMILRGLAQG